VITLQLTGILPVMESIIRVLIDADPIVYRAGFSAQNDWNIITWYTLVADGDPSDPDDWNKHEFPCLYKVDRPTNGREFPMDNNVEQMVEELGLVEDQYEVVPWVDPLPLRYALHLVKQDLENTVKAVEGFLAESEDSVTGTEVFLSGSTNFRNTVATIRGYKANRTKARPAHYAAIRDYMVREWGATVYEGLEADDALSIQQWAEDEMNPTTIIATIDKDLQNVPGLQYNYGKKESYYVSMQQATVHFYRQLLTGDTTDNIPGVYRCGQKTAEKLIKEEMEEREMYEVCLAKYNEMLEKHKDNEKAEKYINKELTAEEHCIENARLLWMLTEVDEAWTPPGQPMGSLTDLDLLDEKDEFE